MQVNVNGATIDVRVDGAGERSIIMLAGFPLTADVWNDCVAILASTHRVIRPELRGIGASSAPPGPYLMEALAGDIAAVLDALGVERAPIVGHSLGGYVALAFARMYTERVQRLALVCSRLSADTALQAQRRNELADRAESSSSVLEIVETMLPALLAPQTLRRCPQIATRVRAMASVQSPLGLAALLRGMALRDASYDIAADLAMPVLVIAGAEDSILQTAEARASAAAFPNGRAVILPECAHTPMLEDAAATASALEAFLAG